MLYDRQTIPGLVALYDIRPGNGAGQFLQPRSPHGAYSQREDHYSNQGEMSQRHALGYGWHQVQRNVLSASVAAGESNTT